MQKPHPPLWIGAQTAPSIRKAAEGDFRLLLGQAGSPELVAENIGIYRRAVETQGRAFDPMSVSLNRALHLATTPANGSRPELRSTFMRNVQQLSLSPTGECRLSAGRGGQCRPRKCTAQPKPMRHRPAGGDVERLKSPQTGSVEYVMVIDVGGDRYRRCAASPVR